MNVLYFWPIIGYATTIVGREINRALDEAAPASLTRRHARVPHVRSPIAFSLRLTRRLALTHDAFDSYFSRFVLYPFYARWQRADVYHIIDDHNGNLVSTLDPRRCVVGFNHAVPSILAQWDNVPPGSYAMRVFQHTFSRILGARFIVTATEHVRRIILSEYGVPPERVVANPYGCAPDFHPRGPEVRERVRAAHGWPADWFMLLHVGSHAPRKNIESILMALAQLPADIHLVRVGEGLSTSQHQLVRDLELTERVHLVPHTQRVAEYFNAADLFVYPSLMEGFGLTLLEAMASGLPLITSNRDVMAEVAGDGAELVDPQQPADLAAAILRCYRSPEARERLRQAGLRRARTFSWRQHANRLLELYQVILSEAGPARP